MSDEKQPGHVPHFDIQEMPCGVLTSDSAGGALLIRPWGTGDLPSCAGEGFPVLLEWWEGKPRVIIWADINSEDPTHIIDLRGAMESNRLPEGT